MRTNARMWIAALALCPVLNASGEGDYWTVDHLQPPEGVRLEVGGMAFLSDGRLALSTRRGQVWIVDGVLGEDPLAAEYTLFAEGLFEGLGLQVIEDEIYVLQRTELSHLVDEDGDGRCDRIDTLFDDWGVSGNYHEFAFGLPVDEAGDFYMSLNLAFLNPKWWHGKSPAPYRGWILKLLQDGTMQPFACGLRSPCGLALSPAGDLFCSDNQGDWMASCPIFHIEEGGFYGHPASLDWTPDYQATRTFSSDTNPPAVERSRAAIWIPYEWSRSTGNMVFDTTGGKFGPFEGQMILGEVTNGSILRAQFEEVQGQLQGAVFPLREQVGAACRVAFAPDGTLFVGMTNRGWGGRAPADGVARVRFTGLTPMEMHSVHLLQEGFEVTFTETLDPEHLPGPADIALVQYDYDYWWEYGSPERHRTALEVKRVELVGDGRVLRLHTAPLQPGMVVRARFDGVQGTSGLPLLHTEFAYTINQLPEGPRSDAHVTKVVPPPPVPETDESGWLRLTWGDALDLWDQGGWELVDAELDPADRTRFLTSPGVNALCNTASATPMDFVSRVEHGDAHIRLGFMLPEGGHSGVLLQGRYEIQLSGVDGLSLEASGALAAGPHLEGRAPAQATNLGPGAWSELDIVFRAPRFDENGRKTKNALLESVSIDGVLVQENVELTGVSSTSLGPEVARGPICIRSEGSAVAIGNVQLMTLEVPAESADWTSMFEDGLEGWNAEGGAGWEYDDGSLYGEGDRSHLFSPRGDYLNFEVRAEVKISDGGNSGLYFRVARGPGWPAGYEAQINASMADPQKSGSLYNFSPRTVQLVGPDTWFAYRIACQDEAQGTRVRIWVNEVLVNDFLDRERTHGAGHIAIQQHHQGSMIEIRDLQIREL